MRPFNPLLGTLPRIIRIPSPADDSDRLAALVDYALAVSTQPETGSRATLLRLSEFMFVEVIRRYVHSVDGDRSDWLSGLRDPVVARALHLLHTRLAMPWTLQTLAREVGCSRSTLAERFTSLIGVPPMQYLTRWRMQVASTRLLDGTQKTITIANEVGYDSDASFSRAFKREVGATPSQWRQRAQLDPD